MGWRNRVTDIDAPPKEQAASGWRSRVKDLERDPPKVDIASAAVMKAAQGGSMGALDELSGLFEGVGSVFGVRGLGGPTGDISLGDDRTFSQAQAEGIQRKRDLLNAAQKQHPITSTISELGGGIASGVALPMKAVTTAGKVGSSALMGGFAGANYADGDLLDRLQGFAGGALIGGGVPAIAETAPAVVNKVKSIPVVQEALSTVGSGIKSVKDTAQDSYQYLKGAIGAGHEAASARNSGASAKPFEFAKGAISAIKQGRGLSGELDELRAAIGSGKQLGPTSPDDPIIGLDLISAGPSKAKDFVTTKAAGSGGNEDADLYKKILEMGIDRRLAAREFNNKAAAKQLQPTVAQLQEEFAKAKKDGYSALQQQARQSFQPQADDIQQIFNTGNQLVNKRTVQPPTRFVDNPDSDFGIEQIGGEAFKVKDKPLSVIPAKNQSEIETALEIIENGTKNVGGIGSKFSDSPWDEIPSDELFDRLQYARRKLDDQINYFQANKMGMAEGEVLAVRDRIDDALKKAPRKIEADELYSRGDSIENKLFGATEFRGKDGRTDVDEFKLAKLFNDNDSAGRFGNTIEEAQEFLNNPNFNQDTASRLRDLLTKLKETRDLANDKRAIEAFRQKAGPSSPAIQLQSYLANRAKLPSEAIGAPAGFVNSLDQFMRDFAVRSYGKPFAELPSGQQKNLLKLYLWNKNNPKATQAELQQAANKLLGAP